MDTPGKNCKVDPLNTIAEGFGRSAAFWVDVLAHVTSAHLRGRLTVGVSKCRVHLEKCIQSIIQSMLLLFKGFRGLQLTIGTH